MEESLLRKRVFQKKPSSPNGYRILIVDDNETLCASLFTLLIKSGFECEVAFSVEEGKRALHASNFNMVITDMSMPPEGRQAGVLIVQESVRKDPTVPVLVITGYQNLKDGVQAMKAGAIDYLAKPFDVDDIEATVNSALGRKVRRVPDEIVSDLGEDAPFAEIITIDPAMHQIFSQIRRCADTTSTVLLHGETGTGKELLARAIHRCSNRSERFFVPVNCGAIPEGLVESELFGAKQGAFTDAQDRPGRFRMANKGTIFLDEIGDMPLSTQVKILRVLQEGAVQPVGEDKDFPVDVRVVAATHQNLEARVEEKKFRQDLMYRLDVIRLEVPPLRERLHDILRLAIHFIGKINQDQNRKVQGIDQQAQEALLRYPWPGNVRELENIMERVVILRGDGLVTLRDLPSKIQRFVKKPMPRPSKDDLWYEERMELLPRPEGSIFVHQRDYLDLEDEERSLQGEEEDDEDLIMIRPGRGLVVLPEEGVNLKEYVRVIENSLIDQALERCDYKKSRAADLLQMKRTTLVERLKKRGLS